MGYAIATQEGLSIEYDEDVCCDVCQSVSTLANSSLTICMRPLLKEIWNLEYLFGQVNFHMTVYWKKK